MSQRTTGLVVVVLQEDGHPVYFLVEMENQHIYERYKVRPDSLQVRGDGCEPRHEEVVANVIGLRVLGARFSENGV